jgi:hypothetical protein
MMVCVKTVKKRANRRIIYQFLKREVVAEYFSVEAEGCNVTTKVRTLYWASFPHFLLAASTSYSFF